MKKDTDEAATAANLGALQSDWRSTRKQTGVVDGAAKTAEVVKKMRVILNKLTPEKFENLIGQKTKRRF